ncbi:helix-turn-helix transcriptional regulator [Allopusillimonas ginsengisoli]|uniref:helix-turn-helix transcriptional regulator n=1 Tax=Allopusillimonas ginsengisoli TaxID=453575 RepID=UPI00143178AA|nr:helix-turn-helix transcriptional regulator [Allopusillimonas ginsengisoli]
MNQWIRAARTHAQLTQTQLGELLGVSKGNVSAWENGHHEASVDQINKIAEITNFSEGLSLSIATAGRQDGGVWVGWPFEEIDQNKIRSLSRDSVITLQAAILIAAGQVGLDVKKNI